MQNMPTPPTQVYVCDIHRITHRPASVCQPFGVSRFIIITLILFLLIFMTSQIVFSSNSGSTALVAWSWQVERSGQERLCLRNKPWSVYPDDVCNVDDDDGDGDFHFPQSKVGGPSPSSGPVCVDCLNPWTGEHLCENCGWPLCNDCGKVAAFAKNVLWKLKIASALRSSPSS